MFDVYIDVTPLYDLSLYGWMPVTRLPWSMSRGSMGMPSEVLRAFCGALAGSLPMDRMADPDKDRCMVLI